MMKHEFEKLTGKTVTWPQYERLEALYMRLDMDKYQFAKAFLKGAVNSK